MTGANQPYITTRFTVFLYVLRGQFNNPANTMSLSTDRQKLYVMISFNKRQSTLYKCKHT